MFSKAKRFDSATTKNPPKIQIKRDTEKLSHQTSSGANIPKASLIARKPNSETQSQCSSMSAKSFKTPKLTKSINSACKTINSIQKAKPPAKKKDIKVQEELIRAHEVEIKNKDYTILEYNKQIDDLKNEIAKLHKLLQETKHYNDLDKLNEKLCKISINDGMNNKTDERIVECDPKTATIINNFKYRIIELEKQCDKLENEVSSKQVDLSSLEEVITIRDSLCIDLQKKLTEVESCLEESRQRLEMVKGHHALALEANESIRREYKVELETLKLKLDEEKQAIINKCKTEHEGLKSKYNTMMESIQTQLKKEKDDKIEELQNALTAKDQEMKAKLEQINETTHEKLRLCEIQFEERSRHLQEHWSKQQKEIHSMEKEIQDLKYSLDVNEDQSNVMQKDINNMQHDIETLKKEKDDLINELENLKEESKKKIINFENEINKLTVEVDRAVKEKNKFEMSLSVTRDIVQVLTMRLRESDNELERLESQVQTLTDSKEVLEMDLASYKNSFNNTLLECNEYKEALVNILKSKAALAKEHNRIMEHNVSLMESLQNVEKEAYRELGSIKNELIEDVEMIKKESSSQIQMLKDEIEKKRMLCEMAREHAGQAAAAAEQSRSLLAHAAQEIARLEADNHCLQQQIQDQQSLVVELSLLRQENEELTITAAKQSSIVDKMKKEAEQVLAKPKSPSVLRKTIKIGKENVPTVVSPLRERNH